MGTYQSMSSQEQTEWVVKFSRFLVNDYPIILKQGAGWQDAFKRGLEMLKSFTVYQKFIEDSLMFEDFERRIMPFKMYIEDLKQQVIKEDGTLLVAASGEKKRGRGRPSKAEMAERENDKRAARSGRMDAVAAVAGMKNLFAENVFGEDINENENENENENQTTVEPSLAEKGNERRKTKNERPDDNENQFSNSLILDKKLDDNENGEEKKYSLQEVKYLLSGELQEEVDRVAMLRQEAAMASEKAKDMALAGKKSDKVAAYAEEAADKTAEYKKVYAKIDAELAEVYIKARMTNGDKVQGSHPRSEVLKHTEWYYRKVVDRDPSFEARCLMRIAAAKKKEEKEKALGMTEKELKRLLKNYHDYFVRTDKIKPSEQKIKNMEEKIAHMKRLGVDTAAYEKILEKERKRVKKAEG